MCPGRSLFVHAQRTLPHRRATAGPARRAHMPSARAPRRPVACCPSPNRCPAVVAGCGPLAVLHPVALCLARAPPRRCVGLWSGARLSAAGPFLRSRAGRGNFLQSPAEARAGAGPALRALRCSLRSAARATPLRPRALLRAFAGPRPPAPVARRCRARKSGGRRRARSGAASCSPQSHKFTSARPPRFALAALPFPCRSAPAGVFPRAPPGRAGAARRLRRRARRGLRPCPKKGRGGGLRIVRPPSLAPQGASPSARRPLAARKGAPLPRTRSVANAQRPPRVGVPPASWCAMSLRSFPRPRLASLRSPVLALFAPLRRRPVACVGGPSLPGPCPLCGFASSAFRVPVASSRAARAAAARASLPLWVRARRFVFGWLVLSSSRPSLVRSSRVLGGVAFSVPGPGGAAFLVGSAGVRARAFRFSVSPPSGSARLVWFVWCGRSRAPSRRVVAAAVARSFVGSGWRSSPA